MPHLWIVGGPNGAGKSTLADRWLAPRLPVVSPDAIAARDRVSAIEAARHAIDAQERFLNAGSDFAVDTTFSGQREIGIARRAAASGYRVGVIFVGVASPALCQARILQRVEQGGHAVPPEDVLRRYGRSLLNLAAAFEVAERVYVFDNTGERRRLVLSVKRGRVNRMAERLPAWAQAAIPPQFRRSRSQGLGL